jgi:hypothetical protein
MALPRMFKQFIKCAGFSSLKNIRNILSVFLFSSDVQEFSCCLAKLSVDVTTLTTDGDGMKSVPVRLQDKREVYSFAMLMNFV